MGDENGMLGDSCDKETQRLLTNMHIAVTEEDKLIGTKRWP